MSDLPLMQPLFDSAAFEAVCVQWAKDSADIEAVWEGEDGPQPDRSYASFSILTLEDLDYPTRNDVYNAVTDKIERGYYKLQAARLQVTVLSDSNKPAQNAHRYAEMMITALWSDQYKQDLFLPNGVGIARTTSTRRLPMLEDGVRWRSKVMFEVEMTVACNQTGVEDVVPIRSVRADGTLVTGVNGDLTITETITDV
jgi:hypothetical protein